MPANYEGTYDNLLQGISQQPNRDRLPGQCTDQLNLIPDPIDGLRDRPPLIYNNLYFDNVPAYAKWHHYKSNEEEYIIAVYDSTVRVCTYDGVERTVTVDSVSSDYLSYGTSGEDKSKLFMVTTGDVTLISNSEVTPTILQPGTFPEWADALIYFRAVMPGRKMTFTVTDEDGNQVGPFTYTVPLAISSIATTSSSTSTTSGSTTTTSSTTNDTSRQNDIINKAQSQGTDVVAKAVYDILVANSSFNSYFSAAINGSVIHIASTGTTSEGYRKEVTLSVTDDLGGTSTYAINRAASTFGDLPPYAPDGYVVRIVGGSAAEDDYYMQFEADSGTGFSTYSGEWVECTHPKQNFRINSADMPQGLIRNNDGTFKLVPLDPEDKDDNFLIYWKDREAGDDTTNEAPRFIGNPITDMGLFQERLYFISGEWITFSETEDYWDFFKKSATTELVTDPINKPANNNEVSSLKYAVQHNRDLIVFADDAQFRISGRNPITQNSIAMVVTTNFQTDLQVSPVAAGEVIFFPFRSGAYSGIREFYTNNQADTNNARPVSAQVDKLIKGSVTLMEASSQEDILILQSASSKYDVYIYNYLWQEGTRVQAAWSRWLFDNNIMTVEYFFFDASDLYVMLRDDEGNIHGCVVKLENADVDGLSTNIYLDFRLNGTGIYEDIILPEGYPIPEDIDDLIVIQGPGCPNPGMRMPTTGYDEGTRTITLKRTLEGGTAYVGRRYKRSYKPSMPVIRDYNGKYIQPDRFIASSFELTYEDSGPFVVNVTHPQFGEFQYINSNRITGLARVGEDNLNSDTFPVGIRMPVDELELEYTTDSHLPINFSALVWKGQITRKGKRV